MKRLRIIAIIVAVLLLGWVMFYLIGPKEPSYQGRKLSQWLADYNEAYSKAKTSNEGYTAQRASEHAVKEIGANAIPILLRWLLATNSPTKVRLNTLLEKQHLIRFRFQTEQQLVGFGALGLQLLGDDAKSAIPSLIPLLKSQNPDQRYLALECLGGINKEKSFLLPIIIQLLHDPDRNVRDVASMWLESLYPEEAKSAGLYEMFPGRKVALPLSDILPVLHQDLDTNRQYHMAVYLRDFYPEEAEKAGVYKMFPSLKPRQ